MNKHTQGKWHYRTCTAGDGKPIVTIDSDPQPEGGLYEICRQYLDDEPQEAVERIQADFRLIAAAPEMLEALENTLWFLDHRQDREDIRRQQDYIKSVMTKAKGES